MSYENFHKRLENIISKTDEYFNSTYKISSPTLRLPSQTPERASRSSDNVHVHHHHNSDKVIILPSPVTNNYIYKEEKKEKKEEKKDDDTVQSTVGGTLIIGAASFAGTYMIANDEYTNYLNSEIENDINELINDITLTSNMNQEIIECCRNIRYNFDTWSNKFTGRTYSSRNAKLSGTLSAIAVGGGLIVGAPAIMLGGSLAFIGSGCYYIYNHFTTKIKSETNEFNIFMKSLCDAKKAFEKVHAESNIQRVIENNVQHIYPDLNNHHVANPASPQFVHVHNSIAPQIANSNIPQFVHPYNPQYVNDNSSQYASQYNPQFTNSNGPQFMSSYEPHFVSSQNVQFMSSSNSNLNTQYCGYNSPNVQSL